VLLIGKEVFLVKLLSSVVFALFYEFASY
jgi:hypothetical protein